MARRTDLAQETRAIDRAERGESSSPRRTWYTVLVLIIVAVLSGIDRNILSILAEPIKGEFALSDAQLGLAIGLVFAVSYSLSAVPLGMLVDRFNRVKLLGTLVAIWSSMTALSGFAWSIGSLMTMRIVVASAESGAHPASLSMIGDLFPKKQRATATGFFFIGTALSLIICFAVGGYIASEFGWRAALLAAGVLGVPTSALVFFTLREPKRGAMEEGGHGAAEAPPLRTVLKKVFTDPLAVALAVGSVSCVVASSGLTVFLSSFFMRTHDLGLMNTGFISAVVLGSATLVAGPLGGFVSDSLSKRSPGRGLVFLALMMIAAIPCGLVGVTAGGLIFVIPALFLYKMCLNTFFGPTFAAFTSIGTPRMRGVLGALLLGANNVVGYGLGPVMIGACSDALRAAGVEHSLQWAMALVATGCCIVSGSAYAVAATIMRRRETLVS